MNIHSIARRICSDYEFAINKLGSKRTAGTATY